jgi:hypothetical protein
MRPEALDQAIPDAPLAWPRFPVAAGSPVPITGSQTQLMPMADASCGVQNAVALLTLVAMVSPLSLPHPEAMRENRNGLC